MCVCVCVSKQFISDFNIESLERKSKSLGKANLLGWSVRSPT